MKEVLIVHNIPNPYRIPLFNLLAERLAENGYRLKIIFGDTSYKRRQWKVDLNEIKFDYEILGNTKINNKRTGKTLILYNGLLRSIRRGNPHCIILTGFSIATLKVVLFSFVRNIKMLVWSGSINTKGRKDSRKRKIFRRILMNRIQGYIAYGSKAKEYLMNFGIAEQDISIAINTTHVEYYRLESEQLRESQQAKKEKFNFLYIGYLTQLKRLDLVLNAINLLATKRNDFKLSIVGDGEYFSELERMTKDLSIGEFVQFHGFKQKPEIPFYLANADCFLFPSDYDIWGLVLVEAMSAGLPCISSIHSGATHDLVLNGETGYAVEFRDTEQLVKLMEQLMDNEETRKQIGFKAKEFILQNLTYEKAVNGFIKAINKLES